MLENNNYIELGGELIFIDSVLVANKNAEVNLGCKKGTKVTVKFIEGGIQPRIGVVANIKVKHWTDLNGYCDDMRGLWCAAEVLKDNFSLLREKYFYTGKNSGLCRIIMRCKIFSSPFCLVEMEKEIDGGCGGDGLGNKNRCCSVEEHELKFAKVEYINLNN